MEYLLDIISEIGVWWTLYFWVAAAIVYWFCRYKVNEGDNEASDFVGNVLVAVLLGWLMAPIVILVTVFGPIRYWRVIRRFTS